MGRHRLPAPPHAKRGGTAVRNGLLGVSIAAALGTAAVTTGLVPVGNAFPYVGIESGAGQKSEAKAKPEPAPVSDLQQQGGLANLPGRAPADAGESGRSASATASTLPRASAAASATPSAKPTPPAKPTPSASASAPAPVLAKPTPAPKPTLATKAPEKKLTPPPAPKPPQAPKPTQAQPKPSKPQPAKPVQPPKPPQAKPKPKPAPAVPPAVPTGHSAEEAAVLNMVNVERAAAGCGPVRANPPLAAMAGAFSKDMAVRKFFGHTDPDGKSPWDRAAAAGLSGLGGENIARGQGDATAVMKVWMGSPGHKANILNCEFRTLGVGMYDAAGGPWWTQNFGF
ncbi:CAP domain-containing protein [Streptomyces sp. NPDC002054]|uniref:CAP domain-containing protein n=1 Tax=Streptomyces sp. NPDC002054 TaxID=3154663 RepID=UPI00332E6FD0